MVFVEHTEKMPSHLIAKTSFHIMFWWERELHSVKVGFVISSVHFGLLDSYLLDSMENTYMCSSN